MSARQERTRFVFALPDRELVVYAPTEAAARERVVPHLLERGGFYDGIRQAGHVDREGRVHLPAGEERKRTDLGSDTSPQTTPRRSRLLVDTRRATGC